MCVLYKSLCHLIDAATMCYSAILQISTLLYESISLLIVIRISVKACIDVTLYDELFNHLHNREKFLRQLVTKDKFRPLLVIQSWITLCASQHTLSQGTLQVRYTAWHTLDSTTKA